MKAVFWEKMNQQSSEAQKLSPLSYMMGTLRAEFLQVVATFRQGICISPEFNKDEIQRLKNKEI